MFELKSCYASQAFSVQVKVRLPSIGRQSCQGPMSERRFSENSSVLTLKWENANFFSNSNSNSRKKGNPSQFHKESSESVAKTTESLNLTWSGSCFLEKFCLLPPTQPKTLLISSFSMYHVHFSRVKIFVWIKILSAILYKALCIEHGILYWKEFCAYCAYSVITPHGVRYASNIYILIYIKHTSKHRHWLDQHFYPRPFLSPLLL